LKGRKVFVVPGTGKRTRKGRSVTRRRIEGKKRRRRRIKGFSRAYTRARQVRKRHCDGSESNSSLDDYGARKRKHKGGRQQQTATATTATRATRATDFDKYSTRFRDYGDYNKVKPEGDRRGD
jgi:hypothetical protein